MIIEDDNPNGVDKINNIDSIKNEQTEMALFIRNGVRQGTI